MRIPRLLLASAPSLGLLTNLSNGFNNYSYSTGITRHFFLNISSGIAAPDGFPRQCILVNGTLPGPTLVLDEGDQVEITVLNSASKNITIHWHGIEQHHTPWSDGVAGITQFSIKPNDTFVYAWKASKLFALSLPLDTPDSTIFTQPNTVTIGIMRTLELCWKMD
ncbi:hypothetical protein P7C70_g2329, partial [Phenoliferia sp. Uapishka_3]